MGKLFPMPVLGFKKCENLLSFLYQLILGIQKFGLLFLADNSSLANQFN